MSHRQGILRPEIRGVGLVSGRRDNVRDRTVVAPIHPYVANACASILWGCCGNSVA